MLPCLLSRAQPSPAFSLVGLPVAVSQVFMSFINHPPFFVISGEHFAHQKLRRPTPFSFSITITVKHYCCHVFPFRSPLHSFTLPWPSNDIRGTRPFSSSSRLSPREREAQQQAWPKGWAFDSHQRMAGGGGRNLMRGKLIIDERT